MKDDLSFHWDLDPDLVSNAIVSKQTARGHTVTLMQLQALMFVAQGNYLASTHHRLVYDWVFAIEHEPVLINHARSRGSVRSASRRVGVHRRDSRQVRCTQ